MEIPLQLVDKDQWMIFPHPYFLMRFPEYKPCFFCLSVEEESVLLIVLHRLYLCGCRPKFISDCQCSFLFSGM